MADRGDDQVDPAPTGASGPRFPAPTGHRAFAWSNDATADAMLSVALHYGLGIEGGTPGSRHPAAVAVVCYVCRCRQTVARAAGGELEYHQVAAFRGFVGVHGRCARNLTAGLMRWRAEQQASPQLQERRPGVVGGASAPVAMGRQP